MNLFKNFKDNLKKAKEDFNKDLEEYRKKMLKIKNIKKNGMFLNVKLKVTFYTKDKEFFREHIEILMIRK